MKKMIIGLFSILLLVGFGTFVYRVWKDDGQMVFPRAAHGTLIQKPTLIQKDGVAFVQWTLPEQCTHNEFEVQEAGYTPNSEKFWGGNEATTCTSVQNGYQCQATASPELTDTSRHWNIQSHSYGCTGDDYFVSEVVNP